MTINISIGERKFEYKTDFILEGKLSDPFITKLRLTREGEAEGIWMIIHPEDKADYTNDVRDSDFKRLGILVNASLCGIPWGAYVPYKLNGEDRPMSVFERVMDTEQDPQYHPEMWKRIVEKVPAQLIEYVKYCIDNNSPGHAQGWIEWAQKVHDNDMSTPHTELKAKIKETIEQCSTALNVQQKV